MSYSHSQITKVCWSPHILLMHAGEPLCWYSHQDVLQDKKRAGLRIAPYFSGFFSESLTFKFSPPGCKHECVCVRVRVRKPGYLVLEPACHHTQGPAKHHCDFYKCSDIALALEPDTSPSLKQAVGLTSCLCLSKARKREVGVSPAQCCWETHTSFHHLTKVVERG